MASTKTSNSSAALLQLYPQLTLENFRNWKSEVTKIMENKEVKFVLNIENPEDLTESADKLAFKRADRIATGIILENISDQASNHILHAETAREMMGKLSSIFEAKSPSVRYMILKRLHNLKCGPKKNIQEHFRNMDSIFDELTSAGSKIDETDKICHLLLSMDEKHEAVLFDGENMDGELTMDIIKNMLSDRDRRTKLIPNTNGTGEKETKLKGNRCHPSNGPGPRSPGQDTVGTEEKGTQLKGNRSHPSNGPVPSQSSGKDTIGTEEKGTKLKGNRSHPSNGPVPSRSSGKDTVGTKENETKLKANRSHTSNGPEPRSSGKDTIGTDEKETTLNVNRSHPPNGPEPRSPGKYKSREPPGGPQPKRLTMLSKLPTYLECQKPRCLTCRIALKGTATHSNRKVGCTSRNVIFRLICCIEGCDWYYITCSMNELAKIVYSLQYKVTVGEHSSEHDLDFENCYYLQVLEHGSTNMRLENLRDRCERYKEALLLSPEDAHDSVKELLKIPKYVDCRKPNCTTCAISLKGTATHPTKTVSCRSRYCVYRYLCRVAGCSWHYITYNEEMKLSEMVRLQTTIRGPVQNHASGHHIDFESCYDLEVLVSGDSSTSLEELCELYEES